MDKLNLDEKRALAEIEELMLRVDECIEVLEPNEEGPLHDWATSALVEARASYVARNK